MNPEQPTASESLLVICLCAQWCDTCCDYRIRFDEVRAKFRQAQFLWIDIEDEAELLHPLDVEDFPTLLLAVGKAPVFFGPVRPQPATLERMIRAQMDKGATASALANPALTELVARIRAAKLISKETTA